MKIVDMHCDTIIGLLQLQKEGKDVSLFDNHKHIDVKKMKQGDYLLQNFAIFTDFKNDDLMLHVQEGIDLYYQELEKNKDYIRAVYTYDDIEKNRQAGYMSAMLTLEEGDVVFDSLAILRNYYRLGVRMITLTWNYPNAIGSPNFNMESKKAYQDMFSYNTKDGLSEFGIAYVQEMERLGIIIDVSHLSDAGFYDVCKYTSKPFVASHSNARSVCGVSRNLSDDMIAQIAKRGGVIGINFCGDFLVESETGNAASRVEDMVKHIKHMKEIGGIDCIALGSDFDGIDSVLEIEDASQMGKLEAALLKEHFTQEEIEKICYKNVLRVYKEVL
ncbi:membrane dipeptidase [Breznakia sp. PF5-3]|uniref:dipeptidase n=1 Tax=unclassified Breznakia TaxID=2623764 RepID=UPI0024072943|nr:MULTISPECIES: dipeptidase [unclassified Breznakia]MDF9824552.1 membrane dipeptidase [Breznakia sp. PM6-1]MDF9835338.1 membrane dipeptidase [Breznakia sp. PF5-3]MDF9837074.1 membrane dipeptidase [Breznakia sp. PFB2-8]MDF9858999.1 membrane dipeptidase [Breznakia sp. PH5-24]